MRASRRASDDPRRSSHRRRPAHRSAAATRARSARRARAAQHVPSYDATTSQSPLTARPGEHRHAERRCATARAPVRELERDELAGGVGRPHDVAGDHRRGLEARLARAAVVRRAQRARHAGEAPQLDAARRVERDERRDTASARRARRCASAGRADRRVAPRRSPRDRAWRASASRRSRASSASTSSAPLTT